MDQESFRRLLQTPVRSSSQSTSLSTNSRGSSSTATSSKPKTLDAAQPDFKPRKIKKTANSIYRDRAAERREGEGNDYAHIEAILEDLVGRDKAKVDFDGDHIAPAKGLNVALLERERIKVEQSTEMDDLLEQTLLEASASAPKKRNRADILRELKEKRMQGATNTPESAESNATAADDSRHPEEAKQLGKFRPIGFKPIGEPENARAKKKKSSQADEGRRKKKRNMGAVPPAVAVVAKVDVQTNPASTSQILKVAPPPEPESPQEEFTDIFASVGEYHGIDVGGDDEDDEDDEDEVHDSQFNDANAEETLEEVTEEPSAGRQWIPTNDPPLVSPVPQESTQATTSQPVRDDKEREQEQEDQPTRLVPLASSVLPSIKDFLAMEKAANSSFKTKKKRKDKKQGAEDTAKTTGKVNVDRDYKRLKVYMDRKGDGVGNT